MEDFTDKWEGKNKVNTLDLPYIADDKRKLFYRFNEATINPIGSPLLVILHGHGTKSAARFQDEHWNVLAPIDHFGYENNGAWWLGEDGNFFIKVLLQKLIKEISEKYACQNNIYFYGSNMGAYGAIYHGILSHARAIYANVPQITFAPSTHFQSFHKNVKAIFGNTISLPIENNLLNFLNAEDTFPIFFLCENIIEEKKHLQNYPNEHTLAFLDKCYQYQIKAHIEILPQEGHTKNYGIKEVLKKFEKFATPLKETRCMESIQILSDHYVWFLNTGKVLKPINNRLHFGTTLSKKPTYLILGNKKVRQKKHSESLINISEVSKLYLKILIDFPSIVDSSVFIQLYNQEMLLESTKHQLASGNNAIDIEKLHPSVSYLKLMFRFSSTAEENYPIAIDTVELCIEEYAPIRTLTASTEKKTSLIPNIIHNTLNDNYRLKESEFTYEAGLKNTIFNFYLNYKPGEKLIIALPGATDRTKPFYNFQRYSWSQNFNYSFMSFLDPTIQINNELSIGWFQGTFDNYALPKLITLLKQIFVQNNIKEEDVLFFGSSAGGFSSLKIANDFPMAKIIVINPQVYVYNYSKKVYEMLIKYSYPHKTKKEILVAYRNRLSVDIDFSKRNAPIYYYQNVADLHHVEKHLKPYINTIDSQYIEILSENAIVKENKKLYILNYNDSESGHSPPSKDKTIQILNDVINEKIKKGYKWIF